MLVYHGGAWDAHEGGVNGIIVAYKNKSAALSHGRTPNVVNLTSDYEDAVDWMMSHTNDLGESGIIYCVSFDKLNKELFRPADILGPQADVKESLESGVVAYEGNITNQIIWVEKHDGDDIIRCRFLSPEHLQLIISEDLS